MDSEKLLEVWDRAVIRLWGLAERTRRRSTERQLRSQAEVASDAVLHAETRLFNYAKDPALIRVGAHTHLRGELMVMPHGGRINIGEWCYVGEGTRIWSAESIHIGDRVLIAHGCEIHDWNAHPLDARERHDHFRQIAERGHPADLDNVAASPVRIEDDAWIGFGCALLKGVTVGRGAVVAARSQITADVPPYTVVAGNPARVVRDLR